MAEADNSSNTPYGSPDFKQNDLVRDYLTKLAQFISGKPVAAGAATPWMAFDPHATGIPAEDSSPVSTNIPVAGPNTSQELAGAIRELAIALRAFQSPAGQTEANQQFFAKQLASEQSQVELSTPAQDSPSVGNVLQPMPANSGVVPIPLTPSTPDISAIEPIPLAPLGTGSVAAEPIPLAPLNPPPPAAFPIPNAPTSIKVPEVPNLTPDEVLQKYRSGVDTEMPSSVEEFKRFLFLRDAADARAKEKADGFGFDDVKPPQYKTFDEMPAVMKHVIDGTDYLQDTQSAANMYRDAVMMFNRRVVNILEAITNDLRTDNSRLAEIERYFMQLRTSL